MNAKPGRLVGPAHVVGAISQAIAEGKLARGYLFSGPSASTLATAESFRAAVQGSGHYVDVMEDTGLRSDMLTALTPLLVGCLDDMAWPSNLTVVVTTEQPESLPPALRGRLLHFDFAWPTITNQKDNTMTNGPTIRDWLATADNAPRITFHVTEIRQERVDVSAFGAAPRSIDGETFVTMRADTGAEIELCWTRQPFPLPEVGSRWTLTPEGAA